MIRPLCAGLLCLYAAGASGSTMNAAELAHELDRVGTTARVLYVAAHPDDENTRFLAWLANERHLVVGYLSMTRGGGGQNLIGGEQGELLDVIRTEELLAARGLDGAVQRFSRMRDFGFSKSAEETFAIWGHDEALADVVRVIRTFQPDVIVTRFGEQPPNHGHHTASAILAREAFAAAADPKRFPEQGLPAWKALRVLHNVPSWGDFKPPADALAVDVGGYDPRLGLGYGELAAQSRSQHKSQGFGVAGERGELIERFVHVAGSKATKDILDGVELGWRRYPDGHGLDKAIAKAAAALERDRPEKALPALAEVHRILAKLPDVPRVRDARAMLEQVMVGASGLFVRATADRPSGVAGSAVDVQVEILARRPAEVLLGSIELPDDTIVLRKPAVVTGERQILELQKIGLPTTVSSPYWLADAPERGRYAVADPSLIGAPRGPSPLSLGVAVKLSGVGMRLDVPVVHAWVDRVHGERIRDFLVVPPATVTPTREAALPVNGRAAPVDLRIRAGADGVRGDVELGLPKGWTAKPARHAVELARAGDETTVRFEVTPPAGAKAIEIRPSIRVAGKSWSYREDVIDYPHIPLQVVLQPTVVRLAPVELRAPDGLIGYVEGSGDTIAEDLEHVGLRVELLDDATLRSGDLSRYAAIVVGIRAYNVRPAMRAAHGRLMRYAEEGGTVVVQYNTTSRWAPLDQPLGPYPFELSNGRITDETAEMVPVDPASPLLHQPNEITNADFEGWVQERGIYFAAKWDERYRPLFRAADPDEAPQEGGTLVADHGRGRYVYTGLAFFRQLRAGVPGAYRLFTNLIAPTTNARQSRR